MPLRSSRNGTSIFAFEFDEEAWRKLVEQNRAERCLSMACCGADAVPKRSSLGTKFFAHKSRGHCSTAPESKEHLLAKDTIARAALGAGWTVQTEAAGSCDDGASWIADVLCMREGGSKAIGFEVQWSRQTLEETARRQTVLTRSDVRALWLMKQIDIPVSRDVPAVRLVWDEERGRFMVWLPSQHYSLVMGGRWNSQEHCWSQRIELSEFVAGALRGALHFDPLMNRKVRVHAFVGPGDCWKCKAEIQLLHHFALDVHSVCPALGEFSFGLGELEQAVREPQVWIDRYFPLHQLARFGVAPIKQRFSRTMGDAYLSNGCLECGALQGRFYEHEILQTSALPIVGEIVIDELFAQACESFSELRRWWFDERALSTPTP